MLKVFSLIKRREDLSLEEFRAWALEQHAPKGKDLPGLRQCAIAPEPFGFGDAAADVDRRTECDPPGIAATPPDPGLGNASVHDAFRSHPPPAIESKAQVIARQAPRVRRRQFLM